MNTRALLLTLMLAGSALGQTAPDVLVGLNPRQQAQVRELSGKLRCLVCQGESVADSRANFALQVKDQISTFLKEGRSQDEIMNFFVTRYGETILLEPPRRGLNWVLWGLPVLALFGGAGLWWATLRRKPASDVTPEMLERVERELGRPKAVSDER